MTPQLVSLSAVIPTRNREATLTEALRSLAEQSVVPEEILVVDASDGDRTKSVVSDFAEGALKNTRLRWIKAETRGAASQRNQGVTAASHSFLLFCDDDVVFEPECLSRLWRAISSDSMMGGVNAMISNQPFHEPGTASRFLFALMSDDRSRNFAGRLLGPAINLLPADHANLPDVVRVEWLNLGATIYRRVALPLPPFDAFFQGYSFMEDVALSARVAAAGWKLANVPKARIFHNSQSGSAKGGSADRAEMELRTRHYIMTEILRRDQMRDYLRLFLFEGFNLLSQLRSPGGLRSLPAALKGKARAVLTLGRQEQSETAR